MDLDCCRFCNRVGVLMTMRVEVPVMLSALLMITPVCGSSSLSIEAREAGVSAAECVMAWEGGA